MLNPCCCVTPRIGTFIFAIIDLVASITDGLLLIKFLGSQVENWIEFGLTLLMIFMAVLLLVGAIQNSTDKLKLFLILWIVLLLLVLGFQIFKVYSVEDFFDKTRIGSSIVLFFIFLYQIWVVYAFIHELRFGHAGLTYCPTRLV